MIEELLYGYLPILIFMIVAFIMGVIAVILSFLLARHNPDKEKNAYTRLQIFLYFYLRNIAVSLRQK